MTYYVFIWSVEIGVASAKTWDSWKVEAATEGDARFKVEDYWQYEQWLECKRCMILGETEVFTEPEDGQEYKDYAEYYDGVGYSNMEN